MVRSFAVFGCPHKAKREASQEASLFKSDIELQNYLVNCDPFQCKVPYVGVPPAIAPVELKV